MKKLALLCAALTVTLFVVAQRKAEIQQQKVVEEGKRLYRLEMASWYGTDIFLEKTMGDRSLIGGYLSYTQGDSAICVFYSKDEKPKVLGTISFDRSYSIAKASTNLIERDFTAEEKELYVIRTIARREISSDTLFKHYRNMNLNIIPIISEGQKKVYILTGPQEDGIMVLGNDYLLSFNSKNELTEKKPIHNTMHQVRYKSTNATHDVKRTTIIDASGHFHTEETGDFITATDVCTLMLYSRFTQWKQHYVVTKNNVNIWNCENNELVVLSRKAWDRIQKDQAKTHSKE